MNNDFMKLSLEIPFNWESNLIRVLFEHSDDVYTIKIVPVKNRYKVCMRTDSIELIKDVVGLLNDLKTPVSEIFPSQTDNLDSYYYNEGG